MLASRFFYRLPQLDAAGYASLLGDVKDGLDDFFDHLFPELYQAYHAQPDQPAQRRYLAECQRTLLRLAGDLLEYTQPIHLYATLSQRSFRDACCHHLYQALDRLLHYRGARRRLDGIANSPIAAPSCASIASTISAPSRI